MADVSEIDWRQAALVVERLAQIAEAMAHQAGVGGMETAGSIVSYLADHPRDIEPCLRFGVFELPSDWHEKGRLTWHRQDGKVVAPDWVRRQRLVKQLEQATPSTPKDQ